MSSLSKVAIIALVAASTMVVGQANAKFCPRCAQIEQERAEHGQQPSRYYDDQISLATPQDQKNDVNNPSTVTSDTLKAPDTSKNVNEPSSIKSDRPDSFNPGGPMIKTDSDTQVMNPHVNSSDIKKSDINQPTDMKRSDVNLQSDIKRSDIDRPSEINRDINRSVNINRSFEVNRSIDVNRARDSFMTPDSNFYLDNEGYYIPNRRFVEQREGYYVPNRPFVEERGFRQDRMGYQRFFNEPTYSTVVVILQSRDFLKTLNGPFTLFVPSNEALRMLPPGMLNSLLRPENRDRLADLVGNHLVNNKVDLDSSKNVKVKTVNGRELDIRSDRGALTVNGAHVLRTEKVGDNGVIYVIDEVMMP